MENKPCLQRIECKGRFRRNTRAKRHQLRLRPRTETGPQSIQGVDHIENIGSVGKAAFGGQVVIVHVDEGWDLSPRIVFGVRFPAIRGALKQKFKGVILL
jgi:hypothetical protein